VQTPEKQRLRHKVTNYAVITVSIISSSWPFFQSDTDKWGQAPLCDVLYLLNVLCMFVSSTFMQMALWKMRRFLIEKGLGD
jgi:hypothetical protein